jgi:hypothetical protein
VLVSLLGPFLLALLLQDRQPPPINYRRRHSPMPPWMPPGVIALFFFRDLFFLTSYEDHVIPQRSLRGLLLSSKLPSSMQCNACITRRTLKSVWQTQVSPKRKEMNDCVHLCGYASRRLCLRRRRRSLSLAARGPMGASLFGGGTKSAINGGADLPICDLQLVDRRWPVLGGPHLGL